MKCLFLYNPNSGKGRIARKTDFIRKRLGEAYETVDVVATSSGEDMSARAREGAGKYDLILFSGGDGTFNNVLQGIGDADVQLGYLPAGTANDVARSLGIPRSVKGALKVVLKGRSERLDCLRINDRFAMYVAAAGSLTSLTYKTPQKKKRKLGWFAYLFHGLAGSLKLGVYPFACECGGKTLQSHGVFLFVMNGRSIAGFPVNKKASMQDGVLEVVLIKQAEKPGLLRRIGAYVSLASFMLVGVKIKKRDIEVLRGDKIVIRTDPSVVWDLDGEEGMRGDVTVEVLPRRVKLFVPKNKKV